MHATMAFAEHYRYNTEVHPPTPFRTILLGLKPLVYRFPRFITALWEFKRVVARLKCNCFVIWYDDCTVKASSWCCVIFVGLRPVIQILCHVSARGWGRWLRYFTEAKAEVKYRASARIRGPKHDTRFEWPVSILIMTRYPFHPFKTHKTSAKNPRLLTIAGAIWFCR